MTVSTRRAAGDARRIAGPDASSLLELMERSLADPGADLDRLDRIAAIYERALAREAEQKFAAALIKMQRSLPVLDELGEITDATGRSSPPTPPGRTRSRRSARSSCATASP